jgi:hypothetical protein
VLTHPGATPLKPVNNSSSVQSVNNLYVSGNVGVGTSGPAYPLQVTTGSIAGVNNEPASFVAPSCGSTNYNMILAGGNDTGNKLVCFVNGSQRPTDGGANNITLRNDNGSLILGNVATNTSILGNVGIGTTGPVYGLDNKGSFSTGNNITTILNTNFYLAANDTTQHYINFNFSSPGYTCAIDITISSYGYDDIVDLSVIKFTIGGSSNTAGTSGRTGITTITSFGGGAPAPNTVFGTPTYTSTKIALPINKVTTSMGGFNYCLTAICTCFSNNTPKSITVV